jgi:hypothetical protein
MSVSTFFGITDLVFFLSDFMNDSTAKQFFCCSRSIRTMLQNNPNRYKVKKRVLFEKVMESLEKWNAEPILIRKDSLMIEFNFHDWIDVWSYTIEDNKVRCHKNAAHYIKTTRSYEVDNELLQRIENYLLC